MPRNPPSKPKSPSKRKPKPPAPYHDPRWRAETSDRMAALKITQWSIAEAVANHHKRPSFTQATVQSALSGRTRPPLDVLDVWADLMRLKGSERESWLCKAISAHLPAAYGAMIEQWRVRASR